MMKVYLAHATDARHEVRLEEQRIEKLTGIELFNPFYDCNRPDIHEIDAGLKEKHECDATEIVERDLKHIKQSDAFLAVIDDRVGAGTYMEMAYAHMMGKKVFTLDLNGAAKHLWVRYHTDVLLKTWDEVGTWLQRERDTREELRITGHNGTDMKDAIGAR